PVALTFRIDGTNIFIKPLADPAGAGHAASEAPRLVSKQHPVTGTVTDEHGAPLQAVTVSVKGSSDITTTDANGSYNIQVDGNGAVLVFTNIGYQTEEAAVNGRSVVDVIMHTVVSDLDEVVVVGYGQQRKTNVVGSVSQIGSEEIENRPVTQATHAITGQMPGVTVQVASGRPGNNPGEIRIRGVGSFGATPDALVLVDGIPGTLA